VPIEEEEESPVQVLLDLFSLLATSLDKPPANKGLSFLCTKNNIAKQRS
jgi:hypothetical protein